MNQSGETAVGSDYRNHSLTGSYGNHSDGPDPDNHSSMSTMSANSNNMEPVTPHNADPEVNCVTQQRLREQPEVSVSCSKQPEVRNHFEGNYYPEGSSAAPQLLYQPEDSRRRYTDLSASPTSSNYTSVVSQCV